MNKFITFEGGEGSGKTSIVRRICAWLSTEWVRVAATHQPGGTRIGRSLRNMLLGYSEPLDPKAELLLFAADRAQHVPSLRSLLSADYVVLCDRYTDSTTAYQGYGRGIDLELVHQVNAIASGGLVPGLTIWLDVDVNKGLERAGNRGELNTIDSEDWLFHNRVRQGFGAIACENPDRVAWVDADQPLDDVEVQVRGIIKNHLNLTTAQLRRLPQP